MSDEVITEPKTDETDEIDAAADPAPVSEAEDVAAVEMVEAVEQAADVLERPDVTESAEPPDPSAVSEALEPSETHAGAGVLNEQQPSAELRSIVEALVFASPDPITPKTLYRLLSDEFGAVRLRDVRLLPLVRPISLKNESIDVMKRFAPLRT